MPTDAFGNTFEKVRCMVMRSVPINAAAKVHGTTPAATDRQAELEGRPDSDEINTQDWRDAGDLLDRRARAIAGGDPSQYPAAWRQARREFPVLAEVYDRGEPSPVRVERNTQDAPYVRTYIDTTVRARLAKAPRRSYREVLVELLSSDGSLLNLYFPVL
jgi:hypothetical protein